MTESENLYKALAVLADATHACEEKWVVGGSAGLLLRGLALPAQPRDLDLYCDESAMAALCDVLEPYAIDQPELSVTSMYRSTLCHFDIHGVQVELVSGFVVKAHDSCYETAVEHVLWPYTHKLLLPGGVHSIHLVPLAHELWFNTLRGREDRVSQIIEAIHAEPGVHDQALAAVEQANRLDANDISALHARLRKLETDVAL